MAQVGRLGVWPVGWMSRPRPRGRLGSLAGGYPGPHWGGGVPGPGPGSVSRPRPGGGVSQHALKQTSPVDGYCCGRYASYWNAFLLINSFISASLLLGRNTLALINCRTVVEKLTGLNRYKALEFFLN